MHMQKSNMMIRQGFFLFVAGGEGEDKGDVQNSQI
jgi:hypothetical protein